MENLPDSIHIESLGAKTIYLCEGISVEEVVSALNTPGEILKNGDKRIVRRVGGWVIKESRFHKGIGPLKMTTNPKRYRNGWLASLEMMEMGLPIPKSIAYVEQRVAGIIWKNFFIYEYIEDALPLINYTLKLNEAERENTYKAFFSGLARTLNQLADARVLHRDLKPLNILTANGEDFYLIDLDEAFCNTDSLPEHRLRNQIQLLDGLRKLWTREHYDFFLEASLPAGEDLESWKKRVWEVVDARAISGKFY